MVSEQLDEIDAREINSIPIGDERWSCGSVGTGPTCSGASERASIPEDLAPDELTVERAEELLERRVGRPGASGPIPATGLAVMVRAGRFGPYVQLGEAEEADGQAADGVAAARAWTPRRVTLERRPAPAVAAPRGRRSTRPTARRSWPRTGGTGRT